MELISQRAYAKRAGISNVRVHQLVKANIIPTHGGKINPEEADRAREQSCDPTKLKGRTPRGESNSAKRKKPEGAAGGNVAAPKPEKSPQPEPTTTRRRVALKPEPEAPATAPPAPPEPEQDEPPDGHSDSSSLVGEKLRGERLKNEQRQIALDKERGLLVEKDKTKRAVFSLARQLREHWLNWPPRIASLLAAELGSDPRKTQAALDRLIREHLTEMSDGELKL